MIRIYSRFKVLSPIIFKSEVELVPNRAKKLAALDIANAETQKFQPKRHPMIH